MNEPMTVLIRDMSFNKLGQLTGGKVIHDTHSRYADNKYSAAAPGFWRLVFISEIQIKNKKGKKYEVKLVINGYEVDRCARQISLYPKGQHTLSAEFWLPVTQAGDTLNVVVYADGKRVTKGKAHLQIFRIAPVV